MRPNGLQSIKAESEKYHRHFLPPPPDVAATVAVVVAVAVVAVVAVAVVAVVVVDVVVQRSFIC